VIIGPCWRCEQPGHVAAECQPPPARTKQELDERIDRYLIRWDAGYGVISTAQKTQWIADEKRMWEKEKEKAK
jgi:hypothetical protein